MPVKLFFGVHVSVHLAVDVGVHLADIYIGSVMNTQNKHIRLQTADCDRLRG